MDCEIINTMKQAAELITLMIDDRDETFLLFILIDEQLKGLFWNSYHNN
jgi:hypothetical protein